MVNRKRNFTLHFYLMAALTTLALGAVNYLGMEYRTRIDLTGDQRFTLSEGTQRLFEKLPDPITVTYYVDEEPPAKRINLERDVRDKLEELASSSGGKLEYTVERISNQDASEKRKELEILAKALLEKEVILKSDVERLIGPRPFAIPEDKSKQNGEADEDASQNPDSDDPLQTTPETAEEA